ncbi:hypothetical protein BRD09_05655 [Halobacteriales archaeon SW_10_68_16]|nr:MAG: hypothetical protein BRD09_05655 [Halobacteriales archaeon SW_10_68_16]
MSQQSARIVREVHDEPHIKESRITVRWIYARVHERGLRPETVAERHGLDIADVYHALAYYHDHPDEMAAVEQRRREALAEAEERTTLTPPDED